MSKPPPKRVFEAEIISCPDNSILNYYLGEKIDVVTAEGRGVHNPATWKVIGGHLNQKIIHKDYLKFLNHPTLNKSDK